MRLVLTLAGLLGQAVADQCYVCTERFDSNGVLQTDNRFVTKKLYHITSTLTEEFLGKSLPAKHKPILILQVQGSPTIILEPCIRSTSNFLEPF